MATQDRWFRGLEHLEDEHLGEVRVTLIWTDGEKSTIWVEDAQVAEETCAFYRENHADLVSAIID